ncbi:MAG: InlB B-repeat-containing protein [Oscillospiraceae bacterium]|nr:InlB B-repeat-containing protein [Oscillospiraceae bacterium]
MGKLKRCFSVVMALAMLMSLLGMPVTAANRNETITLSLEFLKDEETPVDSGLQNGDVLFAALRFSGNPTGTHQNQDNQSVTDGVSSFAIYIQYNNTVVKPYADLTWFIGSNGSGLIAEPTQEESLATDTTNYSAWSVTWASDGSGILKTDRSSAIPKKVPCSEGVMGYLLFNAVKDVSLNELKQAIKICRNVVIVGNGDKTEVTQLADPEGNLFPLDLVDEPTPQKYTVTFDANGGSGSMDAAKVEQGQKLTLPANGFTAPDGKRFKAWNVNGTEYQPEAQVDITADTTVKAVWEDIPVVVYTVTFDANGGTGSMDAAKVEQGKKLTLPACTFTAPDGKRFKAWNVNGTEYQPEAQVDITADTTVKAVWEDIPVVRYTVTFDVDGGTPAIDAVKVDKDATVSEPTTKPTKTDYNFTGWFTEKNGSTKFDFTTPITKDTTIYAGWEEKTDDPTDPTPCYIATSVYGSYDCPEVWTLRRFRDDVLGQTWYGRLFIKAYYATSPTLVRLFGDTEWFQNFWRDRLDNMVSDLQAQGFEDTPYQDMNW